jgi:hypothetical protein
MSLRDIHLAKTGKVSDKWSSYLDFYEEVFASKRLDNIELLEIGVQNGGSLETWAQYFPNAQRIIGVDVDPLCGELTYDDPRIQVLVCPGQKLDIAGQFDIIIDDGSHTSDDMIAQFEKLWPQVKTGGLYIVEDFHTMWMQGYGSQAINYFFSYGYTLNHRFVHQHKDVQELRIRNSLVLLLKGDNELGERLVTGSEARVNASVLGMKK